MLKNLVLNNVFFSHEITRKISRKLGRSKRPWMFLFARKQCWLCTLGASWRSPRCVMTHSVRFWLFTLGASWRTKVRHDGPYITILCQSALGASWRTMVRHDAQYIWLCTLGASWRTIWCVMTHCTLYNVHSVRRDSSHDALYIFYVQSVRRDAPYGASWRTVHFLSVFLFI